MSSNSSSDKSPAAPLNYLQAAKRGLRHTQREPAAAGSVVVTPAETCRYPLRSRNREAVNEETPKEKAKGRSDAGSAKNVPAIKKSIPVVKLCEKQENETPKRVKDCDGAARLKKISATQKASVAAGELAAHTENDTPKGVQMGRAGRVKKAAAQYQTLTEVNTEPAVRQLRSAKKNKVDEPVECDQPADETPKKVAYEEEPIATRLRRTPARLAASAGKSTPKQTPKLKSVKQLAGTASGSKSKRDEQKTGVGHSVVATKLPDLPESLVKNNDPPKTSFVKSMAAKFGSSVHVGSEDGSNLAAPPKTETKDDDVSSVLSTHCPSPKKERSDPCNDTSDAIKVNRTPKKMRECASAPETKTAIETSSVHSTVGDGEESRQKTVVEKDLIPGVVAKTVDCAGQEDVHRSGSGQLRLVGIRRKLHFRSVPRTPPLTQARLQEWKKLAERARKEIKQGERKSIVIPPEFFQTSASPISSPLSHSIGLPVLRMSLAERAITCTPLQSDRGSSSAVEIPSDYFVTSASPISSPLSHSIFLPSLRMSLVDRGFSCSSLQSEEVSASVQPSARVRQMLGDFQSPFARTDTYGTSEDVSQQESVDDTGLATSSTKNESDFKTGDRLRETKTTTETPQTCSYFGTKFAPLSASTPRNSFAPVSRNTSRIATVGCLSEELPSQRVTVGDAKPSVPFEKEPFASKTTDHPRESKMVIDTPKIRTHSGKQFKPLLSSTMRISSDPADSTPIEGRDASSGKDIADVNAPMSSNTSTTDEENNITKRRHACDFDVKDDGAVWDKSQNIRETKVAKETPKVRSNLGKSFKPLLSSTMRLSSDTVDLTPIEGRDTSSEKVNADEGVPQSNDGSAWDKSRQTTNATETPKMPSYYSKKFVPLRSSTPRTSYAPSASFSRKTDKCDTRRVKDSADGNALPQSSDSTATVTQETIAKSSHVRGFYLNQVRESTVSVPIPDEDAKPSSV